MVKKVTIAKGKSVPRGAESKLKERPGGSNVGKYKDVSSFAGPAGGAPKGSYPINTRKRAKAALAYAHNAPKPAGIKAAVHKKDPNLGKPKKAKQRVTMAKMHAMYRNEEEMPKVPMHGHLESGMGCHEFKGEAMDTAYGQASKSGCEADSKKIRAQMFHAYNDDGMNSGYQT